MFKDLSCRQGKTNKRWTVAASAVMEVAVLGIMTLVPLIYTEALPKGTLSLMLVAPSPPAAPVPTVEREKTRAAKPIIRQPLVAPSKPPARVYEGPDNQEVVYEDLNSTDASAEDHLLTNIIGSHEAAPAPPSVITTKRIRVRGQVQEASLLNRVVPEYPAIAKMAHVSGTVELHAIIDADGAIRQLDYVSGPALLINAALSAVKLWRYKPTLLNGAPVEVETTIEVVFRLGS